MHLQYPTLQAATILAATASEKNVADYIFQGCYIGDYCAQCKGLAAFAWFMEPTSGKQINVKGIE